MGVYIKDMEMPKSCDECRIMVFEDTNCEAELYCGCPIVFKAHPQGVDHRPDYCPLVPVPPHGDLIDRRYAIATACSGRIRALPTTEDGEDWIRVEEVRESIKNAPTVIPAELQKEE